MSMSTNRKRRPHSRQNIAPPPTPRPVIISHALDDLAAPLRPTAVRLAALMGLDVRAVDVLSPAGFEITGPGGTVPATVLKGLHALPSA